MNTRLAKQPRRQDGLLRAAFDRQEDRQQQHARESEAGDEPASPTSARG